MPAWSSAHGTLSRTGRHECDSVGLPSECAPNANRTAGQGEAGLSLDTARQLVKFFAMTEAFWIDLQRPHDFAHAWETRDRSGIKFLLSVDSGVTQYGD